VIEKNWQKFLKNLGKIDKFKLEEGAKKNPTIFQIFG
jgi:hypothetical protein